MRKIISFLLAVMLLASFSAVASAEDYVATVALESKEVAVGAPAEVTLNLTCTFDSEAVVGIFAWTFKLPEGVEIVSHDFSEWTALMDSTVTDDSAYPSITIYEDNMDTPVSGTLTVPVTFSVDTSVPGVYTIGSDDSNSMVTDTDFNPMNDQVNLPSATITVKEAGGNDEPATVVPTAATLTKVVETTEDKGWQKGQAVAMTFNVADLAAFADMSWELNFATAGAKYAPVAFDAETIAAIGDEVQFVASFVVNSEANETGDTINSIVAGFCDANKNLVAKTAAVAITAEPVAE